MHSDRLQEIKTELEGLDKLRDTLYDTYDYSVALGDIGRHGLDLLEEVERLRGIEDRVKALLAVKQGEAEAASARFEEARVSDDISTGSVFSHARAAARWYRERDELEGLLGDS